MGILAAAGTCILVLIITHSVKKRTREVGILMSIGLNKKKIRKQLVIEHFIIGITVVPVIGDKFYESINKETEQKIYTEEEIGVLRRI